MSWLLFIINFYWGYCSINHVLSIQYRDTPESNESDETQECNQELLCKAYNATYNLEVIITNQIPSFKPSIVSYNEEIPALATVAYDPFASLIAIKETLYGYLTGVVIEGEITNITSQILMTNLPGSNSWAMPNLPTMLPELMTNLTISAMVVSNVTAEMNCTVMVTRNTYLYEQDILLLVYGCVIAVGLIWLFVGVRAAWENGVPTGSLFSQLLVTVSISFLACICEDWPLILHLLPA